MTIISHCARRSRTVSFPLSLCLSVCKERSHLNKQEKAFKQLVAIVVGFTLCFTPYSVIYLLVALCKDCVPTSCHTLAVWLGYLNSTINPFLYALSTSSTQTTRKPTPNGELPRLLLSQKSHDHLYSTSCIAGKIRSKSAYNVNTNSLLS